jgi:hypothetical protein
MRKIGIIAVLSLLVMALAAVPALAATTINPANAPQGTHLQTGTIGCTVNPDLSVTCSSFELAGVGNTNATVSLVANYSAIIDCFNPGDPSNRNNPIESHTSTFSAGETFVATSTKNGRLTVRSATANPFAAPQVCPNPNWTPVIREGSLQLLSYTYSVTFAGFTSPYILITGP